MAIAAVAAAALCGAAALADGYMAVAVSRAALISVTRTAGNRTAIASDDRHDPVVTLVVGQRAD